MMLQKNTKEAYIMATKFRNLSDTEKALGRSLCGGTFDYPKFASIYQTEAAKKKGKKAVLNLGKRIGIEKRILKLHAE